MPPVNPREKICTSGWVSSKLAVQRATFDTVEELAIGLRDRRDVLWLLLAPLDLQAAHAASAMACR